MTYTSSTFPLKLKRFLDFDTGQSDTAQLIRNTIREKETESSMPSSVFPDAMVDEIRNDIIRAVINANKESQKDNTILQADHQSILNSWMFVSEFFRKNYLLPKPSIEVDVDGDIAFDWDFAPRRVISIRIQRDGSLHYAYLYNQERKNGTISDFQTIPDDILDAINQIVSSP
jgi:hypothetical protein